MSGPLVAFLFKVGFVSACYRKSVCDISSHTTNINIYYDSFCVICDETCWIRSVEVKQREFELLYLTLPLVQCDCHICTHYSVDAVMIDCAALTRTSISATSDTHDLFRQDETRPHLNIKWLKVCVCVSLGGRNEHKKLQGLCGMNSAWDKTLLCPQATQVNTAVSEKQTVSITVCCT